MYAHDNHTSFARASFVSDQHRSVGDENLLLHRGRLQSCGRLERTADVADAHRWRCAGVTIRSFRTVCRMIPSMQLDVACEEEEEEQHRVELSPVMRTHFAAHSNADKLIHAHEMILLRRVVLAES